MKFTVYIAKDGTPYFHVEGETSGLSPDVAAQQARDVADSLAEAFADWGKDEDEQPSKAPGAIVRD